MWDEFARLLGGTWRVIAPDLRGHGASDWSDDYSQRAWVDDVSAVVGELRLERFALIGNTMGSRIAWLYAEQRPERVARLVSVDMSPRMPGPFPPLAAVSFASIDEAVEAAKREPVYSPSRDELFRAFVQRNLLRGPDGRWTLRYDLAVRTAPRDHPGFSATVDEQWRAVRAVACPTLVVATGRNAEISRDMRERMVPAMRDATLLEAATGQEDILLGRPEVLASAVRTFLAK